mmetsp:Transcript_2222/g.3370  ORF Transcript_2222/g.3370 Transcript_2222/m.3370 type:complete len:864 (+) Transcript_2222:1902-4493(+)|eukprot:CAMPEP_0184674334 /NCGR_PEP_ID=MMETSP0308-20130426/87154_1 /TAXON_ID=38269 /ORGANISM="Gloeochaete witrockiana, Strain SAG 46.84" /LENGTH=863 /DNA_ID=CAMNT_0027121923 /DNA_START=1880 /DNA_END=4471 /DNA_ORIENTATION=-
MGSEPNVAALLHAAQNAKARPSVGGRGFPTNAPSTVSPLGIPTQIMGTTNGPANPAQLTAGPRPPMPGGIQPQMMNANPAMMMGRPAGVIPGGGVATNNVSASPNPVTMLQGGVSAAQMANYNQLRQQHIAAQVAASGLRQPTPAVASQQQHPQQPQQQPQHPQQQPPQPQQQQPQQQPMQMQPQQRPNSNLSLTNLLDAVKTRVPADKHAEIDQLQQQFKEGTLAKDQVVERVKGMVPREVLMDIAKQVRNQPAPAQAQPQMGLHAGQAFSQTFANLTPQTFANLPPGQRAAIQQAIQHHRAQQMQNGTLGQSPAGSPPPSNPLGAAMMNANRNRPPGMIPPGAPGSTQQIDALAAMNRAAIVRAQQGVARGVVVGSPFPQGSTPPLSNIQVINAESPSPTPIADPSHPSNLKREAFQSAGAPPGKRMRTDPPAAPRSSSMSPSASFIASQSNMPSVMIVPPNSSASSSQHPSTNLAGQAHPPPLPGQPVAPVAPDKTRGPGRPGGQKQKKDNEDDKKFDLKDVVDVNRMAGVNLEEERDVFMGSTEADVSGEGGHAPYQPEAAFLNPPVLRTRLKNIATKHGIKEVEMEALQLVSYAVQDRLRTLLDKLIQASKMRVDSSKDSMPHVTTSDVKRKLRMIEAREREEKERKDREEKARLLSEEKADGTPGASAEKPKGGGKKDAARDKERKEKLLKAKSEEEDRMRFTAANSAALSALAGVKIKKRAPPSFLNAAASGQSYPRPPGAPVPQGPGPGAGPPRPGDPPRPSMPGVSSPPALPTSAAPSSDQSSSSSSATAPPSGPMHAPPPGWSHRNNPMHPLGIRAPTDNRRITMKDSFYVMEHDSHLRKSRLLYRWYARFKP